MHNDDCILSVNGGSSSIKFSLYKNNEPLEQLFTGEIENIGTKKATLNFNNNRDQQKESSDFEASDHDQAANHLIDFLEKQEHFDSVKAIGHRLVHGMKHTKPELINDDLLNELKKISALDPEHLPEEIKLIKVFKKRYPKLKQVACFDTSFHTSMPVVAKLLSIPRRYYEMGIQRYGFHGLSYAYLMEELKRVAGEETAKGKIILAHLGSGASLAAVKDGKSIDTSMGFTPTSGLPMGTRTGDLDPGVAWYLMQFGKLNPKQFSHLINHESGLLGISETNSDMRELMKIEDTDNRAKEAIELFCYQTKKWIGSYVAALGGLDVLIFSGGIGEHSPEVRSKICNGLEFLGIELDEIKNINNEEIISAEKSRVSVRVIKTNEELMIAKMVCSVLN
ncbi:MAG: acetate/propionate family kinase [Bacteroidota bacterium]|nr:acetate/propionate family kinase [Bacteroidota bacterium]